MASEYETYLRLALPEPTIILGQELQPLSVGHLLYLDKLDLLPSIEPDQLVLAILICTRETADIIPTLQDPWLGWKIRLWLFRHSPVRAIDWPSKVVAFADYINGGTEAPSAISLHDSGKSSLADSGTPFLQHLKATLQGKLNYTPNEALDCAYVQAMWDYYSYHEGEGNVMVCDREQRKQLSERANRDHDALVAEAIQMRGGGNAI